MQKKKHYKYLITMLILLAFFKPGILENYGLYNTLYNYYTVLISMCIIIFYFSRKSITKIQMILIVQIGIYFFATLMGSKDIYTLFAYYVPFLAISMYSEMMIKIDFKTFMNVLAMVLGTEIFINFITVVQNPSGLYGEGDYGSFKYFLGYDNASAQTVVLGVIFIIINIYMNTKKLGKLGIFTIAIGIMTYLIAWTVTPFMAMIISSILIIYVTIGNKDKKTLVRYDIFFWLSIIAFIIIVVFRMQNYFSYFIEDVLKKDLTFTGRTTIWDKSIEYFKESPIIGNGVYNFNARLKNSNIGIYHAHCTYLNILMESGIIGFILYIGILLYVNIQLNKVKYTIIYKMVSIGFLAVFILTLMDVFRVNYTFYILINLGIYSSLIHRQYFEGESYEKNRDNNNNR